MDKQTSETKKSKKTRTNNQKKVRKHEQTKTRGQGALTLVNSIAKYQLQMCQRM